MAYCVYSRNSSISYQKYSTQCHRRHNKSQSEQHHHCWQPRGVFTLYPLEFADVKVAFFLELLELYLDVGLFLLESGRSQLQYLVLFIELRYRETAIQTQRTYTLGTKTYDNYVICNLYCSYSKTTTTLLKRSSFCSHLVSVLTPQYQLLWQIYCSSCVKCLHGVFAMTSLCSLHMPHFGPLNQHNNISDHMLSKSNTKKAKLDIFQTFELQTEIINNLFFFR